MPFSVWLLRWRKLPLRLLTINWILTGLWGYRIQRAIFKIMIATCLSREFKHDETNRAWWTGRCKYTVLSLPLLHCTDLLRSCIKGMDEVLDQQSSLNPLESLPSRLLKCLCSQLTSYAAISYSSSSLFHASFPESTRYTVLCFVSLPNRS